MSDCGGCKKNVKAKEAMYCVVCDRSYHFMCMNMSPSNYAKMTTKARQNWKCPSCRPQARNNRDDTPVRATSQTQECQSSEVNKAPIRTTGNDESSNSAPSEELKCILECHFKEWKTLLDKKLDEFQKEISTKLTDFRSEQTKEITKIKSQLIEMKSIQETILNTNRDIETSIQALSASYELINKQCDTMKSEVSKLNRFAENTAHRLNVLEKQVEDISRKFTLKNLVIRNVPISPNEDLFTYLENLYKFLRIDFNSNQILAAYRRKIKNSSTQHVVYEFQSTQAKHKLLSAIKSYNKTNENKLNTSHIGIPGKNIHIYISEMLSPNTSYIYYKSREFARLNGYAFCWTKNDRVYLRKYEGAAVIPIRSELQLTELETGGDAAGRAAPAAPAQPAPTATDPPPKNIQ